MVWRLQPTLDSRAIIFRRTSMRDAATHVVPAKNEQRHLILGLGCGSKELTEVSACMLWVHSADWPDGDPSEPAGGQ
jgi:hypothetical protein